MRRLFLFLLALGALAPLAGCKAYGEIDSAYTAVKDTKTQVDAASGYVTDLRGSLANARDLLNQKIAKDDAADAATAKGVK